MPPPQHDPRDPHRLPRFVRPRHYALHLTPDLDAATFQGTAGIDVEVHEPVAEVVLNAAELTIRSATIDGAPATVSLDPEVEQVTLTTTAPIGPGPARIELAFDGVLNDRLRGFYRSTLVDDDGLAHTIATTQFQSTDARRCFPCFDEPDFKATFGVILDVPSHLLAVSNGAQVTRTPTDDGLDRVVFADTIPLSTYLVAFVVGPLEATAAVDVDGVPVRVVHPPGRGHLARFALDVAAHSLRWFADWYDLPVPGGKVDLVALPDFAFGAMENLGCITFREVLLLVDPDTATQRELEAVAAVLSHELAHLWFGDLVTMRWWNGIWLNEAFATFMEMKAVEAYRPDWDVWTGFGSARSAAMDVDSLASTRPIEYPVLTPADAEGMFDLITYEKGAAVVRMLEQYLGETVFRDGVRRYLTTHLHGTTDNDDLWDALEAVSGEPVGDLMHGWIFQGGHPEITGRLTGDRLELTQRPFRYDGVDDGTRWTVPVRVRTSAGIQRVLLDGDRPGTLELDGALTTVNADASGFYRSPSDGPVAGSAAERANRVSDLWAHTLAGTTTPDDFLDHVAGLADETDLGVWQAAVGGLATLDLCAPARPLPRVTDLLHPLLDRLGWHPEPGDDDRPRQLRGLAVDAMGNLADDEAVVERATRWWRAGHGDPAVAAAVVSITATHGDATTFAEFSRLADEAPTAQDQQRHLRALPRFPGRSEIDALLTGILDGTIRTQDAPFLVREALNHRQHRSAVWGWLTENWANLTGRLPSNSIARMLEGVRALIEPGLSPGVDPFLDAHPVPQGALMVAQHRERRLVNARLADRLR